MEDADGIGVRIGRKRGFYLPFEDVEFFLEDLVPPRSVLAQGSVLEDGSVASGGDTTFISVQWLREKAPYALDGRFYEEATTLPFSTRQLAGDPTDYFSNTTQPPANDKTKVDQVKDRAKNAKKDRTTVVKCCLKKRLRDSAVGDAIHDLVEYSSKVTHRTGLMLNWIALRVLNDTDKSDDVKVGLCVKPTTDIGFHKYV